MEKSDSVKNSNTIKTMTPVIEIEHISKRYGKTEALHDVSFTVLERVRCFVFLPLY